MKTNKNNIIGFAILIITFLPLIAFTVYAQKSYKSALRPNKVHRIEIFKDNGVQHAIIFARGTGKIPPQSQFKAKSKLMAKRAARLDGYRKLLMGVNQAVSPHTGVTYVEGYLKGAALYDERENKEQGVMEAEVALFTDVHPDYIKAKREEGILVEYIDKEKYEKIKQKVNFIDKQEWKNWHKNKRL